MKKWLVMFFILVLGYIIGSLVIGGLSRGFSGDHFNNFWIEIYNWWLWGATITLYVTFLVLTLLWQRNDDSADDFFKKVIVIPLLFFGIVCLCSTIFPAPYHIALTYMGEDVSIFKYNLFRGGTVRTMSRYSASSVVLNISQYAFIILFFMSFTSRLYIYNKRSRKHCC